MVIIVISRIALGMRAGMAYGNMRVIRCHHIGKLFRFDKLGGWKNVADIAGKVGGDVLNYKANSDATKAQEKATAQG